MYFLWWLELIAWMKSRVSVLGHSPSEVLAGVRLSFFHVICLQYFFLLCCSGLTNQMLVWHQPLLFWLFLNLWHFFSTRSCGFIALQSYEWVCSVLLKESNWTGFAWCRSSLLDKDGVEPSWICTVDSNFLCIPWWAIARLSGIQGSQWT